MFDFIVSLMGRGGYLSIVLLMLFENVFPPVPSEIVMPLAGFLAATESLNLVLVIVAGTVGSVLGAVLWYWIGLRAGEDRVRGWAERHGRWLTIDGRTIDRSTAWFRRHGKWAVFLGRMIPGLRTFISVPAGVAGMAFGPFLFYTTLGSAIWAALLSGLGYVLQSQYTRVANWLDPVTWAVIAGVVVLYAYRLIRRPAR